MQSQNLRVYVVGKHAIEFEMEEWLFDRARSINRLHDEIGQALGCAAAIVG